MNTNAISLCRFMVTIYAAKPCVRKIVMVNRWDEKAGLRTGCGVRPQVIDVPEAQEHGEGSGVKNGAP